MLMLKTNSPVDYRLCSQTVTVYHDNLDGTYTRTVIERGAFLDFKKTQNVEKTGSKEASPFCWSFPAALCAFP